MATNTVIKITDDIDGREGARPFTFGVDGTLYNIDLVPENIELLHSVLEPFIAAATPIRLTAVKRPKHGAPKPKAVTTHPRDVATAAIAVHENGAINWNIATPEQQSQRRAELARVRAWAAKNKVKLPQRGRIPQHIIEQFQDALIPS